MSEFAGCPEEMYQFFWEIAFQNNREFFEANRERYRRVVQQPMLALAGELAPAALSIDPRFNVRPSSVVSRIRRDTRFTRDKSPYRDHVWLGYKPAGARTSECFVLYAEFERERYGYGMGMYAPEPALMAELRARMLARPQRFLALVQAPRLQARFTPFGESYRRPRFTDCPEALLPWVNRRSLGFSFTSGALSRTYSPAIREELQEGFALLRPLYRFLMGLE